MNKNALLLTLKIVISVGLIWYLLNNIDISSAWTRLLSADAIDLGLAGLVIFVQILISVLRWRTVLIAIETRLANWAILRIYYIGLFFNQVLPSSVGGDGVRIYKSFRAGLSLSAAVHSVILDRIATLLALLFLITASIPLFDGQLNEANTQQLFILSVVMLALGLAGVVFLMFLDRIPHRFTTLKLVQALSRLALDTRKTFLSPIPALKTMGWGILGHLCISLSVYYIAKALALDITMTDCIVLMPPVILVTLIPISIAGWGVREGAMVTAFALAGVQAEDALVLSFLFGIMAAAFAIPGAIIWLMAEDKTVEQIKPDDV